MRHAPSRISTRSKKRPRHTASTSTPSSRERTLIDMRVCAIARAPLISAMVPPRKCCERDPLPKEAWQDATKASKVPSNHVVVIVAPGCAVARSLSQSPVSRASAQLCMSAEIASWSCRSGMLSLRLDARLAKQPRPFTDLGANEGFGLGGRHAQAPAAARLQPRTHFGRARRAIHLGAQALEHPARGACRREQAEPGLHFQVEHAGFDERRHLRHTRGARAARHRERLYLPRVHVRL